MLQTKVIKSLIFIVLVGFIALLWEPAKPFLLKDFCLDQGGKWATNGDHCIYKNCSENSSCRPSFGNNATCEGLELGISREDLYFHLGMPESSKGSLYTFTGGGGHGSITARIQSDKVIELNCGTLNPPSISDLSKDSYKQ